MLALWLTCDTSV